MEWRHSGCADKDECPFVSRRIEEMVLENRCLPFVPTHMAVSSCEYVYSRMVCVRT